MTAPPPLSQLREEIDRIDAEMHALLMQRGRIIDRLIAVKRAQGGGSAFRPAREASMMRALVERHRGRLPVDTVESIWRIVISTFTYVQFAYQVHIDVSGDAAAIRDSERFHFGFTVPCVPHFSTAGVIDAVRKAEGDLGMFPLDGGSGAGAWWMKLADPAAPKIIARLPFVERPDHPAGLPVVLIARPLTDGAARETLLEAVTLDRWRNDLALAVDSIGGEIMGKAAAGVGLSLLIARPGDQDRRALTGALARAGAVDLRIHEVGAHATRFDASADILKLAEELDHDVDRAP